MAQNVPAPSDTISCKEWKIVLQKLGDKLFPIKPDERCSFSTDDLQCLKKSEDGRSMTLTLGAKGLMVTVIQSLMKPSTSSVTCRQVLEDIASQDPERLNSWKIDDLLTKVDNRQARLRVRIFDATMLLLEDMCSETVIQNSKNASVAPVMIERSIGPSQFCLTQNSALILVLKQKIKGSLEAHFIWQGEDGNTGPLPIKHNLPKIAKHDGSNCVDVTIPMQAERTFLDSLQALGPGQLCLVLARAKDNDYGLASRGPVPVNYLEHGGNGCQLCAASGHQMSVKPVSNNHNLGRKRPADTPTAQESSLGKRPAEGLFDYPNHGSNDSGFEEGPSNEDPRNSPTGGVNLRPRSIYPHPGDEGTNQGGLQETCQLGLVNLPQGERFQNGGYQQNSKPAQEQVYQEGTMPGSQVIEIPMQDDMATPTSTINRDALDGLGLLEDPPYLPDPNNVCRDSRNSYDPDKEVVFQPAALSGSQVSKIPLRDGRAPSTSTIDRPALNLLEDTSYLSNPNNLRLDSMSPSAPVQKTVPTQKSSDRPLLARNENEDPKFGPQDFFLPRTEVSHQDRSATIPKDPDTVHESLDRETEKKMEQIKTVKADPPQALSKLASSTGAAGTVGKLLQQLMVPAGVVVMAYLWYARCQ